MREFTTLDDILVLGFLGFLSVEIPELHLVEAGRLMDAWRKYKEINSKPPSP